MRAMKAELMGAIQQTKPQGPDTGMLMMQEMVKQAAEDRREAQKQAAEDRRQAQTLQAASDARFAALLEKMNDRPKENPLEMLKAAVELMGSKKDNGIVEAQTKMMHSMSEMMGQQVSVAMDFVSAAADMQLGASGGEKEPGWLKGLDRVMKGVGAMARGAAARGPIPQVPQQALPAQVPMTFEQQALAQPPAPGSTVAQAVPKQPRPSQRETEKSVIVQIEEAIRGKLEPKQVAAALIAYFQDPSIQKALEEAGGDFEVALQKRLGNWQNEAESNAAYLKQLFTEVEKQLENVGEEEEEEEGSEGGEEAEEGDESDE